MNEILLALYILTISLWTGGIAMFTFIVTPQIFRSFNRVAAGQIVGMLFSGYFASTCILSVLASFLFYLLGPPESSSAHISMVLLPAAVLMNVFIVFKLHPEMARLKLKIVSFEREPPDSVDRRRFKTLHALSAVLNLLLLGIGIFLLIAGLFF